MEGTLAKPNYVVHGKLDQQEKGFHTHPEGQLLYAEKGLVHIEYHDRKILLPMQFCSWIPPQKPHRIWASSDNIFVRAIYFESKFCKNKIFTEESAFPLSTVLKEMIRYTAKWNGVTEATVYETTFLTAIRQMLVDEILGMIGLELPQSDHPRLQPVLAYINDHYQDDIQVEQLAQQSGLSGRTLHRLFTKELGRPFSAYLVFLRLFKAIELLSESDRTIKEVAYSVGYNSIPSFSKMFKAVTGLTPHQVSGRLKGS